MWVHTKKKGRLRCHKRPKSREETPKVGGDSRERYRTAYRYTIATGGSIERRYRSGIQTDNGTYTKVKALAR
jgi:hypothetical protein